MQSRHPIEYKMNLILCTFPHFITFVLSLGFDGFPKNRGSSEKTMGRLLEEKGKEGLLGFFISKQSRLEDVYGWGRGWRLQECRLK